MLLFNVVMLCLNNNNNNIFIKYKNKKINNNSIKCQELGWVCVPLAVETYGTGAEKHTPLLSVWLLGLPSVSLCQKVRSLLIFLADLVWC